MYCHNCGRNNPDGLDYCGACGTKMLNLRPSKQTAQSNQRAQTNQSAQSQRAQTSTVNQSVQRQAGPSQNVQSNTSVNTNINNNTGTASNNTNGSSAVLIGALIMGISMFFPFAKVLTEGSKVWITSGCGKLVLILAVGIILLNAKEKYVGALVLGVLCAIMMFILIRLYASSNYYAGFIRFEAGSYIPFIGAGIIIFGSIAGITSKNRTN